MKINTDFNLFTNNCDKIFASHKVFEESIRKQEDTPVRVDISEQGRESYRKSLSQMSVSFESVEQQREELLDEEKAPKILTSYSFLFGNKLNELKKDDEYQSIVSQADDLLKAYASLYDEIVQGHKNGTRACYVEDVTSASGSRKLTMDEEISLLDETYKKYADYMESQAQQWPQLAEIFNRYVAQMERIGARSEQASRAADAFARHLEEGIPEHISRKLVDASKAFVMQYAKQNIKGMGIGGILKGIVVFD